VTFYVEIGALVFALLVTLLATNRLASLRRAAG